MRICSDLLKDFEVIGRYSSKCYLKKYMFYIPIVELGHYRSFMDSFTLGLLSKIDFNCSTAIAHNGNDLRANRSAQ